MAKVCIEALAAGIRLKEYREEKKLTRNKLGLMAGTDPKRIAIIEDGKGEGTILWYYHIMKYFGLDLNNLFDERYKEILDELYQKDDYYERI